MDDMFLISHTYSLLADKPNIDHYVSRSALSLSYCPSYDDCLEDKRKDCQTGHNPPRMDKTHRITRRLLESSISGLADVSPPRT